MMLLGMGGVISAETISKVTGFGDEITSLDYITDGGTFVISNGTNVKYFISNQNSDNKAVTDVPYDSYFCCTLEKVDDSGKDGDNIYRILVKNLSGEDYPKGISGSYLNTPNSGWSIVFAGHSKVDGGHKYGTDADFLGLWYVTYDAENGFSFQNVGKATNGEGWPSWMTVADLSGSQTYVKLYKSLVVEEVSNPIEVGSYDATDANTTAFAGFKTIADDATWDAETKVFTKTCGWQWDGEGLDLSAYKYIVITAGSSREEAGAGYMAIKDKNGVVVGGDDYGEGYQNMWFSLWNHLFCCKIDLEKLRQEKTFDIRHITELTIDGGDYFMLGTAYATNKEPQVRNRWGQNEEGSVRIMGLTAEKFGTICLPYQAAVACAKIYEIAGKAENYISLVEHDGLLEAGKAYFYCTTKNTSDAATENKVFFYQATDATVDAPIVNNGLIGTFDAIEKVASGSVVLNNNKLYTVDSDVALAANKAYIDLTKISGDASRGTVTLNFDETTGIEVVKSAMSENGIFNLNGQRLAQPKKGLNIIGGKKVMMK